MFSYAYAVFHSPTYRQRYAEFLKGDFPRLPLTGNKALFAALVGLGAELVSLHLMESPRLESFITRFPVSGSQVVEGVRYEEAPGGFISTQSNTLKVSRLKSGPSPSGAIRSATNGSRTARAGPSPLKTSTITKKSWWPWPKPSASWQKLTPPLTPTAAGQLLAQPKFAGPQAPPASTHF